MTDELARPQGDREWLERLAASDPGAAEMLADVLRPPAPVPDNAEWIVFAWKDLIHDRQVVSGMTTAFLPLSFSAIDAWARRYGIEGDAFEFLKRALRSLDAVYLRHANARPDDEGPK